MIRGLKIIILIRITPRVIGRIGGICYIEESKS